MSGTRWRRPHNAPSPHNLATVRTHRPVRKPSALVRAAPAGRAPRTGHGGHLPGERSSGTGAFLVGCSRDLLSVRRADLVTAAGRSAREGAPSLCAGGGG